MNKIKYQFLQYIFYISKIHLKDLKIPTNWTISSRAHKLFRLMGVFMMSQVEGLMRLMEGEHVGPFNLGNPGEFTMLELAKVK